MLKDRQAKVSLPSFRDLQVATRTDQKADQKGSSATKVDFNKFIKTLDASSTQISTNFGKETERNRLSLAA